ncbi:unnamed protein product [Echinostoma caproni]|uniref:Solute carrier family 35 member B1 n=1 Tax=Echinostoma caproni TaxID=27848 RepID=A0A183BAZ2_9TREM|nr:unnamed protein product [Echinostoma caproni]
MGSRLSEVSFLIFCSLGVFFSYLVYGILQEAVTKSNYGQGEKFNYFFSLLLFQCIVNSLFSLLEKKTTAPEWNFALCGLTYIGAMFASNYSLKFVSYPVQVIGKSVKPIPVLLLHVLLAKRKYPLRKYVFVTMISVGVALFMYKGRSSANNFLGWGEALLVSSLLCDFGSYTLMLHMNLWSTLYLFIGNNYRYFPLELKYFPVTFKRSN